MAYEYNPDTSLWIWDLAHRQDVADIVALTETYYENEIAGIYTADPIYYAYQVERAILDSYNQPGTELIITARHRTSQSLMAYGWVTTQHPPLFSRERTAEAKILHVDPGLSSRQRVLLTYQCIEHWQRWAELAQCLVLVSSTIRRDQQAFLHIHRRLGFELRGSIAYKLLGDRKNG